MMVLHSTSAEPKSAFNLKKLIPSCRVPRANKLGYHESSLILC